MKKFLKLFVCVFLFSSVLKAQDLPTMPPGGPDNGTFDKSGRYPAGAVNHTSFYSAVAGKNVDIWIYTPPGYSTSQKYGVIFCYQGIGVDAGYIFANWCVNAGIVCDNLIGEGKISKGVILVAVDDQFAGNNSNVRDMTIRDAIPYIDSHYSTYADADHRGVYGYSWGGGYTFNVGCRNLDYFHYMGPSAAAPNKEGDNTLFPNGGAYAKQVMKCLFISWGQSDYQSIIDANVACVNYCNSNGIPHYKWVGQGQGHTAGVWRPAMWNFLQLADRAGISNGGGCTPSTITPYVQVNGGTWQQTSSVTVASGATVVLGPQPESGGSWSWSGCGTSGTSREQTISPTASCTATATYTNACGAKSTQNFNITVGGSSSDIVDGGIYRITPRNGGKALDVNGCGTSDGTNVQNWSWQNNDCQKWQFTSLSGGYWRISPMNATSKALDVNGESTADGANVQIWNYTGGNNQQWQVVNMNNGYYHIVARHSGKCLDLSNGSTADGANIQQWTCSSSNTNQDFSFTSLKSAAEGLTQDLAADLAECKLYPSPVDRILNITFKGQDHVNVKIYNNQGALVLSTQLSGTVNTIDVSKLVSGIYFIKLEGNKKTISERFIKK